MIFLGKLNTLRILRDSDFGLFLGDQEETQDVLLPKKYVPKGVKIGDEIDVFIYNDSEDRLVATTLTPKIQLNACAYLKVKAVTSIGAFLDWGLEKDLLVPFSEQVTKMKEGESYVVYLKRDAKTNRLVATEKVLNALKQKHDLSEGEEVDLLIYHASKLGMQVIINGRHLGLLYHDEIFQPLTIGDQLPGYVKRIREDGKIDVSLQKQGYAQVEDSQQVILDRLNAGGGTLAVTDKSSPEAIMDELQMSKKVFKKAVGALYKQRLINIGDKAITLVPKE